MRIKELITLALIGFLVSIAFLFFARNKRSESPENLINSSQLTAQPTNGVSDASPQTNDNPKAFGKLKFIYEKRFEFEKSADFQRYDNLPRGHFLRDGQELELNDVSTHITALGLLVEARASSPRDTLLQLSSSNYKEGVNIKPEIKEESKPVLKVLWDGKLVDSFPLGSFYWQPYYTRIDGDGKDHRLTLELELPEGESNLEAALKRVAVFSLDNGLMNSTSIGIAEAGLRAQALRRKIIILGLDGIDWDVVDPLLEQGKLPNLQRLIDDGVRSEIIDEHPLDSPKIWTSIATGKRAVTHGIDRRVYPGRDGVPVPVNSTFRKTKALWNQFSDFGRTVGIVNWMVTWPSERVNGFIVSDRAQYNISYAVYPELLGGGRSRYLATESDVEQDSSLFAQQLRSMRQMKIEKTYPARNLVEQEEFNGLLERIEEVYFTESFYRNYGIELYKQQRPDLFALYFHGTDAISHGFYKFHFPDEQPFGLTENQLKAVGDPMGAVYQFHDRTLGQLMEVADADTTWLVLSDHGFQAQQPVEIEKIYVWNLNLILEAMGLLQYKSGTEIDWANTRCYTSWQMAWNPVANLRVNLRGREEKGIVREKHLDSELDKMSEMLRGITFEATGKPVFRVTRRQDLAQGEASLSQSAYELDVRPVFEQDDFVGDILIGENNVAANKIFKVVPISGNHEINGVMVLSGPGVRSGVKLKNKARMIDIAPTVLSLSGLPVGEDMDGKVLLEALDSEFLRKVPVRTIPSYDGIGGGQARRELNSDYGLSEVDAQSRKWLESMGYI